MGGIDFIGWGEVEDFYLVFRIGGGVRDSVWRVGVRYCFIR